MVHQCVSRLAILWCIVLGTNDSNTSVKHNEYEGNLAVAPTVQMPVRATPNSTCVRAILYRQHTNCAERCDTTTKAKCAT